MQKSQETSVIIIGGGPTGLSLALGLAKYHIKSILLEKKSSISEHSKAPVIHQRTREIFEQWGLGEQFLSRGNLLRELELKTAKNEKTLFHLDFKLLSNEAKQPGMLILKQSETEKILLEAVKGSGFCEVRFDTTAFFLKEVNGGVEAGAKNEDGEYRISGKYVVGCDGASGFTRQALGLSFPGKTYDVRTVLADVNINDKRNELHWPRIHNAKGEITVAIKIDQELWRLIHLETNSDNARSKEKISEEEINQWVINTLGEGSFKKVWESPFEIHRRSSPRFKVGRTLLAGDSAHVHSPVGAQGMNAGIQDAHNLAWKLATVLRGGNEWRLLHSYETERKEAVVEKVSGYTDLMTRSFLQVPFPIRNVSFFLLRKITSVPGLREKFLRRITMINLRYTNSEITDPLILSAGKRLPNIEIFSPDSVRWRLYDLLTLEILILIIGNPKLKKQFPHQIASLTIGDSNYRDPSQKLKKLLGHENGFILVRPDMHIGWAGTSIIQLNIAVNKISAG